MLFWVLFDAFDLLTKVLQGMVVIMAILSLLFAFNVINSHNAFLLNLYQGLSRLLEPLLAPFRRILPDTGGMDFSPIALLVTIELLRIFLIRYALAYLQ